MNESQMLKENWNQKENAPLFLFKYSWFRAGCRNKTVADTQRTNSLLPRNAESKLYANTSTKKQLQ